jgi:hypothetical protein
MLILFIQGYEDGKINFLTRTYYFGFIRSNNMQILTINQNTPHYLDRDILSYIIHFKSMGSFLQKLLTNPEAFKFYTENQEYVLLVLITKIQEQFLLDVIDSMIN